MSDYETRKERAVRANAPGWERSAGKETSNLFRKREGGAQENVLSVRDFNHVLSVNTTEGWVDAEGYGHLCRACRCDASHDVMPAVVPQLKTITIGGAVSGMGIESTSFRYGLVHETVLEMEILLPSGETIVCRPDQNADLFYGFPNSYGTLGYALRLKVKVIPVKPFVHIAHVRYDDVQEYFRVLEKTCDATTSIGEALARLR